MQDASYHLHIGVFVFDTRYLMTEYIESQTRCQLSEDIEWLKLLEHGYAIHSIAVEDHQIGVDTIADLEYLRSWISTKAC